MPWVRSVAPSAIRETLLDLNLQTGEGIFDSDIREISDAELDDVDGMNEELRAALDWATACDADGNEQEMRMTILAGSLYLVADFYRLLGIQG